MPVLGQVERVDEAQALERFVVARQFEVGVFDVQRGDVVRQQHHFVGEELLAVHAGQMLLGDAAEQIDEEVARPGAGVEDLNVLVAEFHVELRLQNFDHAGAHEVDDLLRRVDNAVRVGRLDRVALKEPFVDGVEEVLLLAEVFQDAGGVFDGPVKPVERLQEGVPVEALAGQRRDHLLDFDGNHVPLGKLGVVKNLADQPLGQQVLNQHLVNRSRTEVGIQRCATQVVEAIEGVLKLAVIGMSLRDFGGQRQGELRHAFLKLSDGLLKTLDIGLGVGIKRIEQIGQLLRLLQISLKRDRSILEQNRAAGVLKNRVGQRITLRDLLGYLGG